MSYDALQLHPDAHIVRCDERCLRVRALAVAVITQALADLRSRTPFVRSSALHFIRIEGGGVWADYLGIDRSAIRLAAPITRAGGRPTHKVLSP